MPNTTTVDRNEIAPYWAGYYAGRACAHLRGQAFWAAVESYDPGRPLARRRPGELGWLDGVYAGLADA